MYELNNHAIAPFASHALSILVFVFLVAKNPRSPLHISLGLFCLSASLWQLATGMMFIAQTDELALVWDRLVYVGVNFQWLMHFQFTVILLGARDQKWWLIAAYSLSAIFALAIPTDLLIHDLYRYTWGCHAIAGPLHHPFVLVSTGFYTKCLWMIFQRFRRTTSEVERNQYKYYMVGFTIFVSASIAYLPAYEVPIYPFSYWFESVYCLILVYIIVRHRMLDIETVIHKTLLWLSVSLATFVPVVTLVYFAYPLATELGRVPLVASTGGVIALSVALFATLQPRINHLFERRKLNYRRVVDEFLENAITLNDREKLAAATQKAIVETLYSGQVRCFWGSAREMRESAATSPRPSGAPSSDTLLLRLEPAVARHMTEHPEPVERDLLPHDPAYRDVKAPLAALFEQTGTSMLLPIVREGALHGIVMLGRKSNLTPYTRLDKRFLREVSLGISVAVINALMFETQRHLFEREKEARRAQEELLQVTDGMNRELERQVEQRTRELSSAVADLSAAKDALWGEMQLAKKIQTVLLPKEPRITGYELCAYMRPADEVGGDFYDVINTEQGDWIVIGDVSGHGVGAGLVMMMVQLATHTALAHEPNLAPQRLLSLVNDVIMRTVQRMHEEKHVTMSALCCLGGGAFGVAGLHQDILVYREQTGSVENIATDGVWLGLVSPIDHLLVESSVQLGVGDVMLLFTDGLTEAIRKRPAGSPRAPAGEMFGQARLGTMLADVCREPIRAVKERIVAALEEFECDDDVTFILVQRTS